MVSPDLALWGLIHREGVGATWTSLTEIAVSMLLPGVFFVSCLGLSFPFGVFTFRYAEPMVTGNTGVALRMPQLWGVMPVPIAMQGREAGTPHCSWWAISRAGWSQPHGNNSWLSISSGPYIHNDPGILRHNCFFFSVGVGWGCSFQCKVVPS